MSFFVIWGWKTGFDRLKSWRVYSLLHQLKREIIFIYKGRLFFERFGLTMIMCNLCGIFFLQNQKNKTILQSGFGKEHQDGSTLRSVWVRHNVPGIYFVSKTIMTVCVITITINQFVRFEVLIIMLLQLIKSIRTSQDVEQEKITHYIYIFIIIWSQVFCLIMSHCKLSS